MATNEGPKHGRQRRCQGRDEWIDVNGGDMSDGGGVLCVRRERDWEREENGSPASRGSGSSTHQACSLVVQRAAFGAFCRQTGPRVPNVMQFSIVLALIQLIRWLHY
jgi:hypothetical protein